jgi:hypothetical protein
VRPDGWDDERLKLEAVHGTAALRWYLALFAADWEAKILQNLDHPHILRIFSWYEDGDSINIAPASSWLRLAFRGWCFCARFCADGLSFFCK